MNCGKCSECRWWEKYGDKLFGFKDYGIGNCRNWAMGGLVNTNLTENFQTREDFGCIHYEPK